MRSLLTLAIAAAFGGSAQAALPAKTSELDTQTQSMVIAEAMQSVAKVQPLVASYRLTHEDFPSSNAEAGIKPPAMFASNSVKGLAIGPGGVIDLTLTAASGVDDGLIRFRPAYAPQSGAGDFSWTCASASFTNIGDLTGGNCEHTSQP